MAVRGQETQVLVSGIQSETPTNGSFALNMLKRRGAWEARDGFGQRFEFCTTVSMPTYASMTSEWGIDKHLGSHLFTTNTGHKQLLSVFSVIANSANSYGEQGVAAYTKNNIPLTMYVLQIDDLTDGTRHVGGNPRTNKVRHTAVHMAWPL